MHLSRSMVAATLASSVLFAGAPAGAHERRFAFTDEAATLDAGEPSLEPGTTLGVLRGSGLQHDLRLGFELGLTERLQIALSLNAVGRADGGSSSLRFGGLSWEWKLNLLEPVANSVGLAVEGAVAGSAHALDLQGKLILDKRFGDFLAALNFLGARGWGLRRGMADDNRLAIGGGFGFFVTPSLFAGVEAFGQSRFVPGQGSAHALFAGAAVSYASEAWWASVAVLPRVASAPGGLQPDASETLLVRLLVGLPL